MDNQVRDTVIYDGVCNLCNSYVRFVKKFDKKNRLNFIPLQTDKGEQFAQDNNLNGMEQKSVVFVHEGKKYFRSRAIRKILNIMGGGWKIPALLIGILPVSWSDVIYDWVARNRYRWFGKIVE